MLLASRVTTFLLAATVASLSACSRQAPPAPAAATAQASHEAAAKARAALDTQAGIARTAWRDLAPSDHSALAGLDLFEPPDSGRTSNLLRALATVPKYVAPFAGAYTTVLVGGSVDPALKMAMALRVAQLNGSVYVAAHMTRLLRAVSAESPLLTALRDTEDPAARLDGAEAAAIRYTEWLTQSVQGVTDERFGQVRAHYTDAGIVELTATVGFFNFLVRFAEAQHLPLEPWVVDTVPTIHRSQSRARLKARVTLVDDAIASAAPRGPNAVNSLRAMALVPDIGDAWWGLFRAIQRDPVLGPDILYHVSFAVSMANGCRYCSMHQIRGLADLGVDPAKLMAMEKDDSLLTPRELTAVRFARTVTENPTAVTAADWQALAQEFGVDGALEVLVRTCEFAFMNRFTDNLGLPTEDAAVETYKRVHGGGGKYSR